MPPKPIIHPRWICQQCGAAYDRPPHHRGRFCSPECFYEDRKSRRVARFWSKIDTSGDCWIWTASTYPDGYGCAWNGERLVGAHRLAWEYTNGPVPDGLQVLHRCDRTACCNPAHLFLGDNSANVADRVAKGRTQRHGRGGKPMSGEANAFAKLTEVDVRQMRVMYDAGEATQVQLAARFGVYQTTVSGIVRRRTWRHVA